MKMKKLYLFGFILLLFIISCSTNKKTGKTTTLKFSSGSYTIKLPSQAFEQKIIRIGLSEMEYQYIFKDSSKIFCTDQVSSSPLIHPLLTYKDYISFTDNDTLSLSFLENDKYYCVRKIGDIFIGYSGIKKENKQAYDNTINTLKKR